MVNPTVPGIKLVDDTEKCCVPLKIRDDYYSTSKWNFMGIPIKSINLSTNLVLKLVVYQDLGVLNVRLVTFSTPSGTRKIENPQRPPEVTRNAQWQNDGYVLVSCLD